MANKRDGLCGRAGKTGEGCELRGQGNVVDSVVGLSCGTCIVCLILEVVIVVVWL